MKLKPHFIFFIVLLFFSTPLLNILNAKENKQFFLEGITPQKTLILDLTNRGTFEAASVSADGKHSFVLYKNDGTSNLWFDGKIVAKNVKGAFAYFGDNSNLYHGYKDETLNKSKYFRNEKLLGSYDSFSTHISPDLSLEVFEVSIPKEKFFNKHFLIINGKELPWFQQLSYFTFLDKGHEFAYIGSNRKKEHQHLVSTDESYLIGNNYKLGPYKNIEYLTWGKDPPYNDLFLASGEKEEYLIAKGKIVDHAKQINQVKYIHEKLFYITCNEDYCQQSTDLEVHWGNDKLGPYEFVGSTEDNREVFGYAKNFGISYSYPTEKRSVPFGFLAKKNNQYYAVINFKETLLQLEEDEVPLSLILSQNSNKFAVLLTKKEKELILHNNQRSQIFDSISNPRLTADGNQLAFTAKQSISKQPTKPNSLFDYSNPNTVQLTVVNGSKKAYPKGCLHGPIVNENPPGFSFVFNPPFKEKDRRSERSMDGCNMNENILITDNTQKTIKTKPYYETKIQNFKAIAPFELNFQYPKGDFLVLSSGFDYEKHKEGSYHSPYKIYYNKNYLGQVDYIFDAKLSEDEKNLGVLVLQGNQIWWVVNSINPFQLDNKLE